MNITFFRYNTITVAECNGVENIATVDSMLELLANSAYQGASVMIVHKENLDAAFFELKTGLAGDMLQKFSNYRMKLAIVGDFSEYSSKSLKDFMLESNRAGRIVFVTSVREARGKLFGNDWSDEKVVQLHTDIQ